MRVVKEFSCSVVIPPTSIILQLMRDDINFETRELRVTRQIKYTNGKLQITPPKTKAAERTKMHGNKSQKPPREKFEPRKGKYRRQGTGSIYQVSKSVWEGRYSSNFNGKRIIRNVYATSIEECEQKLAELIEIMNAEIEEMKTNIGS